MTPNQLVPSLEGLVGSGLRGGANASSRQRVTIWLEAIKTIMRSQLLRAATDWELVATDDAVNADTELDATGGTIYGVLADSVFDVANEDLIVLAGNSGGAFTFDATAFDWGTFADNGVAAIKAKTASASAPEFATWLDPSGQVCSTDVNVSADGEEGTAPTSLDVRVYVVYRSSTEIRV